MNHKAIQQLFLVGREPSCFPWTRPNNAILYTEREKIAAWKKLNVDLREPKGL